MDFTELTVVAKLESDLYMESLLLTGDEHLDELASKKEKVKYVNSKCLDHLIKPTAATCFLSFPQTLNNISNFCQ